MASKHKDKLDVVNQLVIESLDGFIEKLGATISTWPPVTEMDEKSGCSAIQSTLLNHFLGLEVLGEHSPNEVEEMREICVE